MSPAPTLTNKHHHHDNEKTIHRMPHDGIHRRAHRLRHDRTDRGQQLLRGAGGPEHRHDDRGKDNCRHALCRRGCLRQWQLASCRGRGDIQVARYRSLGGCGGDTRDASVARERHAPPPLHCQSADQPCLSGLPARARHLVYCHRTGEGRPGPCHSHPAPRVRGRAHRCGGRRPHQRQLPQRGTARRGQHGHRTGHRRTRRVLRRLRRH